MKGGRRTVLALALVVAACGETVAPAPKPVAPPTPAPAPVPAPTPVAAPSRHWVEDVLEACKRECVEAFRMQDPDERLVLDRLKTAKTDPTCDDAEWARLTAAMERVRARNARLASDPRFLMAEKKANWVRENPVFRNVELARLFADPYVIFQERKHIDPRDTERKYNEKQGAWEEVPKDCVLNPAKVKQNEVWAKKAELFARRDAALLLELHRRFRELFADDLPTLSEKGRMLTVLVMWNRQSFDDLLKEAGQAVSPSIRAFYSPAQQKCFTYLGDEAMQQLDEIPCADGWVQKSSDQALLNVATDQLRHEYAAIVRGRPLQDSESKVEVELPAWLTVGVAEFLSAVEVKAGKSEFLVDVVWRHEHVLLDRVMEAQRSRVESEKWTLAELMKPIDHGSEPRLVADLGGPSMASLASGRAWAFVHFLWNYDGGKYRAQFIEFVHDSLRKPTTSAQFAKAMKRPDAAHWGDVEREFEWYWDRLLDRRIGKSATTGEWETPSTAAPTGRVQDDEAWPKKHAGK